MLKSLTSQGFLDPELYLVESMVVRGYLIPDSKFTESEQTYILGRRPPPSKHIMRFVWDKWQASGLPISKHARKTLAT
jgi:hypothetical protein